METSRQLGPSYLLKLRFGKRQKKKIFCNKMTTEVSLWILPSDALLPNSGKDYHF